MENKEIAKAFQQLGNIMELHNENKFKIRSYQNAYLTIRKLDQSLVEMKPEEIAGIKGIGKAISGKINELLTEGKMATLERYKAMTPDGIQEMLNIKGFGPKKIAVIWKDLEVETIGELLYAVNENRLIELKGFGGKTQEDLRQKLEYYQKSKDKFHYATLEAEAISILEQLKKALPETQVELTGAIRRKLPILHCVEVLVGGDLWSKEDVEALGLQFQKSEEQTIFALSPSEYPVRIYFCPSSEFGSQQFLRTGTSEFLESIQEVGTVESWANKALESDVFKQLKLPEIPPELREEVWGAQLAKNNQIPQLIEESDIRGVIHSHTTDSDGIHSLEEMINASMELGYAYIGITDHSKSAFYANGLQVERVLQQFQAIDDINERLKKEGQTFVVFKGIESDILADGSLDYEQEILQQFDFIIASVHSNLRMDEDKATKRLINAIENPYTTMLGHPTGRLLLSREGYPIDHKKVIDACAANVVAIEINANPYRLDLDWTWIPYAMEKEVLISINPDAHSQEGIKDIHFGVLAARKGGLTKESCLNARNAEGFRAFFKK